MLKSPKSIRFSCLSIFTGDGTIMQNEKLFAMDGLTPKQKRVALLLIYGKTRRDIAETLGISENTVKTHTQRVFKKLGVKSQKALMSKHLIKADDKLFQ